MGDRGIIVMVEDGKELSFYTHWTGGSIREVVAEALSKGRDRWDDASYLNRIVFSTLVGTDWEDTTGYGIWVGGDNDLWVNNPSVYVFTDTKTVFYEDEGYTYDEWITKFGGAE